MTVERPEFTPSHLRDMLRAARDPAPGAPSHAELAGWCRRYAAERRDADTGAVEIAAEVAETWDEEVRASGVGPATAGSVKLPRASFDGWLARLDASGEGNEDEDTDVPAF